MTTQAPATSPLGPEDIDRLWSRVDKSGGPDACWPWTRAKDQDGYALFKVRGRMLRVARTILMLDGLDVAGKHACHKCDNPSCCNRAHLFVGTPAQNVADRDAKGRASKGDAHWTRTRRDAVPKGSACGAARVTENDVQAIRWMYSMGMTQEQLASVFGVVQTTIGDIVNRKTWRHVHDDAIA